MVLLFAFFLDLFFGDPGWIPHPVRGVGAFTGFLEKRLYPLPLSRKISGLLLALVVISVTYLLSLLILRVSLMISSGLEVFMTVLMLYTTLSVNSLYRESMKVFYSLEAGDIEGARKNVSMIVGRDTHNLSQKEIVRASVETVAENIVDGIIAPIFWWVIGGAPLAMAYKAANTLDSMVGYKNERYMDFGRASARFDDLLNYIPARLSLPLITVAAFLAGKEWRKGIKTGLRDGRKNPSPNAGIPEAVVAGALQVELGGLNYYGGRPSQKELIGESVLPLSTHQIREVNRVMLFTSVITVFFALIW